jgi:hypothetical protein
MKPIIGFLDLAFDAWRIAATSHLHRKQTKFSDEIRQALAVRMLKEVAND